MSDRLTLTSLGLAALTILTALLMAGLAIGVKLAIAQLLEVNAGFVIYVPAIAVAAWLRGLPAGLLTTLLTGLADALTFLPPLTILAMEIRDDQVRLAAYLFGGVTVSFLSHSLRRARDHAVRQAAERRHALEAEAEARARLDELLSGQRQAAVLREAFNSMISHELRTPITSIYAAAKLLARRDRQLDEETRLELTEDLEKEAERLYRLVEDLLILARTERGAIEIGDEPVMISHVAERVIRSEQARWPAARFERQAQAGIAAARGDETYIEQVLRNLLSNAAKYSPAGALITLAIDQPDEGPRVRVLDEGAGLDAEEAQKLFELYYRSPTTAATTAGAGIGLFVCRSLIEAMGGRIWAAPRPGGGAEFGFVLPAYEEGPEAARQPRTAARGPADVMDQAWAADSPQPGAPADRPLPEPRPD